MIISIFFQKRNASFTWTYMIEGELEASIAKQGIRKRAH